MSIRIQNDGIAGTAAPHVAQTAGTAHTTAGVAGAGKGAGSGDQVDLSSLSGAVSSQLSALASKQADRVSQLTALYAKGQYQLDATHLSRALISNGISAGAMESEN